MDYEEWLNKTIDEYIALAMSRFDEELEELLTGEDDDER
jgi:hypothetical protein